MKASAIKIWEIDPTNLSITPRHPERVEPLITEVVGVNAYALKLDIFDNLAWVTDADTNPRFGFYFERMGGDYSTRRYSKGLIISLSANSSKHWGEETIRDYLRFVDRRNDWPVLPMHFLEPR
jgi:hypothetical protein